MKFYRYLITAFLLVVAFGLAAQSVSANIIRTGQSEPGIFNKATPSASPSLAVFARSVTNGRSDQVTGVYVQGGKAFPILQQPASDAGYVSDQPNTLTQFRMAAQYHTIGLLAHDYLAGASFQELQAGSELYLVYGDGRLKNYRVYEVQQFQALSPSSPYSSFIDLSDQTKLSADQLFYRIYGLGNATLVLQTCISTPSVSSWGRIFILARPVEDPHPAGLWDTLSQIKQSLSGVSAQ